MAAGAMGATSRQGNARMFSQNNRFSGNHYVVRDPNAAWWSWEGGMKTWAQWQAAGHDADGIVKAPAKK